MFITALMIAAKFHDDFRLSNKDFAKIGGISSMEIRSLEEEFLTVIRFNVNVECEDFENYADGILRPAN
jgi:hypothetical protein